MYFTIVGIVLIYGLWKTWSQDQTKQIEDLKANQRELIRISKLSPQDRWEEEYEDEQARLECIAYQEAQLKKIEEATAARLEEIKAQEQVRQAAQIAKQLQDLKEKEDQDKNPLNKIIPICAAALVLFVIINRLVN